MQSKLEATGYQKRRLVSFCVVCRDRLEHLQKTLPHNLELLAIFPDNEIVILDYNSSYAVKDWVLSSFPTQIASGSLSFYRTDEPQYYIASHSKNVAHLLAKGKFISNLDADNFMSAAYLKFINYSLAECKDRFAIYFHGEGVGSRIGIFKEDFVRFGGYNEELSTGWGYDDSELIGRIRISCTKSISTLNTSLLGSAIEHSDVFRTEHMQSKSFQSDARKNAKIAQATFESGRYVANAGKIWGMAIVKDSKGSLFELNSQCY